MAVDFVFLDSGTGGIPYMLHLKERMKNASCVYIGDTANFPYGEKSHEQIVDCVLALVKKVIEKFEPEVIVLACNTMSVNALDVLREAFPHQLFVGTVPAIKVAAEISKKRCFGLLATNSTCKHPYNLDLQKHFASDCLMVSKGAPELISFVEHESFTASEQEIDDAVRPSVEFFRSKGCDVIILGCTHFLNLVDVFKKLSAPDITIVDSREGVTNRALALLKMNRALRAEDKEALPAGRGGEQAQAELVNASQGETSPSFNSLYNLFVTGFCDKKDKKEYDVICSRYKLEFGGIL